MQIYVVLYGPGGELTRQPLDYRDDDTDHARIVAAIATMGPLAPGDVIKIEES